jgi:hypothetical protein
MLFSHLRLCLPSGLFPSKLPIKTQYKLLFSSTRVTCPVHLILFNLISIITYWRSVQYIAYIYFHVVGWLNTSFGLMVGFIAHFDTARDYTSQYTITRLYYSGLVAASNSGRSPSSGFLKCHRPQLPVSKSNISQRLNPSSSLTAAANWSWL